MLNCSDIKSPRLGIGLCLASILALALLAAACGGGATPTPAPTVAATETPAPAATATPTVATPTEPPPTPTTAPVPITISAEAPPAEKDTLVETLGDMASGRPVAWLADDAGAENVIRYVRQREAGEAVLAQRVFAVVAPFQTVRDEIALSELQDRWSGQGEASLLVSEQAALVLNPIFGEPPAQVMAEPDLRAALDQQPGALGIVAFDHLDPTLKVLAIDGVNPLDNHLDPATYPLAVALTVAGPEADLLHTALAGALPAANRDPERLSTLIMTGVTAMSRGTAEKMEEKGYLYPSLVISDTLRAADITHVSNEVPFIKGCRVNNTYMNLVLCSDYPYWQALEAIGVDIVGLSGNHVNDFGRKGARESLAFYRDHNIPIYGSGRNEEEACAPLLWEHHGNTFAFIAALAWWPEEAWATADEPGACNLYNNYDDILAMIRKLSDEVDIVSVELQYQETYDPWPIRSQILEFRDMRAAGADIVTGVQSHVPQAVEPYGGEEPGVIVYGLGNLFFDQMENWETRTGLIARHTLYDGRLLSTEILTTVLEDYAQPRWATPDERAGILNSIFAAAPPLGELLPEPTPSPAPPPLIENDQPSPAGDAAPQEAEPAAQIPAKTGSSAHPALSWPAPADAIADHYWLGSPVAPNDNRFSAPTYPFGGTANGAYRVHHGSDIANPMHTPLLAPDDATIVYAGPDDEAHTYGPYPGFYGNVILFQLDRTWHDQPVYVLYGHLEDVNVSSGQHVSRGEPVGGVGMAGIAIGPHLHVETRLGGTGYDDAVNADLWLEPPPGFGTIAGQVVTPDGRAWHEVRLHLYRLQEDGSRLFRIIPTYAEDPGLHPDPERAENFVFANVPAGEYQLVLRYDGQNMRRRLTVRPGETAATQFTLTE